MGPSLGTAQFSAEKVTIKNDQNHVTWPYVSSILSEGTQGRFLVSPTMFSDVYVRMVYIG